MTEREAFLTRWSRRKREADAAPESGEPAEPAAVSNAASTEENAAPADEVDLSALPPIESITASTDISAFLKAGIPAPLTRAALRRAWVADPAIRDFVGLAENAWDFNAPDGVPGFGSLLPSGQAQQVIADLLENGDATASASSSQGAEKAEAGPQEQPRSMVDQGTPTGGATSTQAGLVENDSNVAPHEEQREVAETRPSAPRHGGALPR